MIWVAVILALGLVPFVTRSRRENVRVGLVGMVVWVGLLLAVAWGRTQFPSAETIPEPGRPVEVLAETFEGSGACQACHPDEYATWYGSYHRTMT